MDIPQNPPQEVSLTYKGRKDEYGSVRTYNFVPDEPLTFSAGSYAHVRVFGLPEGTKAVREFSIASCPQDAYISFGIDNSSFSSYQERLLTLVPGEKIGIFKIKSHLTWPLNQDNKEAVFIAGGIGVTPFRSMLRDKKLRGLQITTHMIHFGRDSFLYKEELEKLTNYSTAGREKMKDVLTDTATKYPTAHFYVAGSPEFCEAALSILNTLHIEKIESDSFKGLKD